MGGNLKLVTPARAPIDHPALQIAQLSKAFDVGDHTTWALQEIDFDARPGELICILGPSGCGKTTLLKIIAGFMKPSSGRVFIEDRPITRPGADRGVVFQEDALFPWLTAAENVAMGLKGRLPKRELKQTVDRMLSRVGLAPFRHFLPRQLSGGMKQRVALARVLVLEPKVLLMDEPFGALDAQTREEMQQLLLALWGESGHTIVFVTHDISEAIVLADRILIMGRPPDAIRQTISVPLPRPRKKESDDFHRFYRSLRGAL